MFLPAFIQLIPLVGQINLHVLTNAVFHKDGFVILMMTAVTALMNKDALQVRTLQSTWLLSIMCGSYLYIIIIILFTLFSFLYYFQNSQLIFWPQLVSQTFVLIVDIQEIWCMLLLAWFVSINLTGCYSFPQICLCKNTCSRKKTSNSKGCLCKNANFKCCENCKCRTKKGSCLENQRSPPFSMALKMANFTAYACITFLVRCC